MRTFNRYGCLILRVRKKKKYLSSSPYIFKTNGWLWLSVSSFQSLPYPVRMFKLFRHYNAVLIIDTSHSLLFSNLRV